MGALFQVTRLALILAALGLVGACANRDDAYDIARAFLQPNKQEFDARFQSASQRGAPMLKLALLEFDAASLLVLDSERDGVKTWITPDGGTISMRDGMLVAMKGFGAGLMASDVSQTRAVIRSGQNGTADRFHTFLTGDDTVVTRTYRCVVANQGSQEIMLRTGPLNARLMSEDCRSLDQSYQNLYWINPSNNRIVQTSEWSGEFIGTIATQVVP